MIADFCPERALVAGNAAPECRAVVILPARNEEDCLTSALDALAGQVDRRGELLQPGSFEVILLLNNCTDCSMDVAQRWKATYPELNLHLCERTLPPEIAHVGTARRLLMDAAWWRLGGGAERGLCAILSTDADTVVAPDWVCENLHALAAGADAVGGEIRLKAGELETLPPPVQQAYLQDRAYQRLVAELEDLLNPQHGDPWPRHLEHFGASLACTPQMYALAGGVPAVRHLEDVAFVDALRRVDATLRHEPRVWVETSGRMHGRVETGLSGQLRCWHRMDQHLVESAAYLSHRFRTLQKLRRFYQDGALDTVAGLSHFWVTRLTEARLVAHNAAQTFGRFLAEVDCNRLIDELFAGQCDVGIQDAIAGLIPMVAEQRNAVDAGSLRPGLAVAAQ